MLYLAGAANASQAAYSFASALLGVLLATYVLSRLAASGTKILRVRIPARAIAGEPSTAVIEVANRALIPKPRARVAFSLRAQTFPGDDQQVAVRVPPLRRGARAAIEVDFTVGWRGLWRIDDLRIEGSDPLGLFVRPEPEQQSWTLVATPAYWEELPLPWQQLLAPGTRMRMSAQRAESGEYRTVRDYVPGDDIRHVHWQASAHRNKLQVKVYDQRREIQAQIWLAAVGPARRVDRSAELAVSAAATLAHAFAMAPLPTILRAPGLPGTRQGPGSGEVFWKELLGSLGELPYCSVAEIERWASEWSRSVQVGGTIYLVSNSSEALLVMADAVPRGCWAVRVLATPERSQDTPAGHICISAFEDIPQALFSFAAAGFMAEAVVDSA